MTRIEKLLERKVLTDGIDGDCRSARGKILVLLQKNMAFFQKLLDVSITFGAINFLAFRIHPPMTSKRSPI
jgi:hypothetical protein